MKEWTEAEDHGCIVGCALSDILSETLAALIGRYTIIGYQEEKCGNPDPDKVSEYRRRKEEILSFRRNIPSNMPYEEMRILITLYSNELNTLNNGHK
jgi:hypothetical protein